MLLTRELATLTGCELTLEDALRITALQPSLPLQARRLIEDLLERILAGASLSEACSAHPTDMPPYYCRLLAAGERSGNVATALASLAGDLEHNARLQAELRTALIYPLILLVSATATLVLVITVLVPGLAPLFDEAGAKPPLVIAMLDWIRRAAIIQWPWLLTGLAGVGMILLTARRAQALSQWRDRIVLALPVVGRLVQRRETGRFAGTLATLLQNGVSQLEAIRVAGDANSNSLYRKAAREAEQHIANGGLLSEALERSRLFAPLALRMTAVGERTGQIDVMLARLQRIEEDTLQQDLQRLVGIAAPVLTVSVGLLVGGILISVMGAIVGLNDLAFQ